MTFTFEDAKAVCLRLRDRGDEETCQLAILLDTCIQISQWTDGLENAMDSQVEEKALSIKLVDYALADLAVTITTLNKAAAFVNYLPTALVLVKAREQAISAFTDNSTAQ